MIEDWQDMTQEQAIRNLRQIGGALRRMGRFGLAIRAEKIANTLDPSPIKVAPIVPRTTSG